MSQIEVERFLGRIITDENFRAMAAGSLENACYSTGFSLSVAEMSFLRNIDYSLVRLLAETIDDSIKRIQSHVPYLSSN
jgi:hypothetical protein